MLSSLVHHGWAQRRKPFGCQRPKQVWVPKKNSSSFVGQLQSRRKVLDSGCTQHMTGDERMFNSINTNGNDGYDSITFVDNGKGKVKGLGKIAISNDMSISMCC